MTTKRLLDVLRAVMLRQKVSQRSLEAAAARGVICEHPSRSARFSWTLSDRGAHFLETNGDTTDRLNLVEWRRWRTALIECRRRPFVHFWWEARKFKSLYKPGVYSCVVCGAMRPGDPAKTTPCRGVVRISLRAEGSAAR